MGRTQDWLRKAIASRGLKITTALLSALGVTAFNSCGLYAPPVAMYMPPPSNMPTISGVVSTVETSPIPGIYLGAYALDTEESLMDQTLSASDGSYRFELPLPVSQGIRIKVKDVDGSANGGSFSPDERSLSQTELAEDADGEFKIDFKLESEDPSASGSN